MLVEYKKKYKLGGKLEWLHFLKRIIRFNQVHNQVYPNQDV
jgi:hypothetical protein